MSKPRHRGRSQTAPTALHVHSVFLGSCDFWSRIRISDLPKTCGHPAVNVCSLDRLSRYSTRNGPAWRPPALRSVRTSQTHRASLRTRRTSRTTLWTFSSRLTVRVLPGRARFGSSIHKSISLRLVPIGSSNPCRTPGLLSHQRKRVAPPLLPAMDTSSS